MSVRKPTIDVVVVSYNSRGRIRDCVSPLVDTPGIAVSVVDNNSSDGSLETVRDLPIRSLQQSSNLGFGTGCNAGAAGGVGRYVLFLNPDARITSADALRLAQVLEEDARVGAAGPLIRRPDGSIDPSQRLFPRFGGDLARALYLHRALPRASWADGTVSSRDQYVEAKSAEWLSGACLLVRRTLFERLGGFDERFFLYCEDMDLCRRIHDAGYEVRFDPRAKCIHEGGASAPRAATLPILATSRRLYAQKHFGPGRSRVDQLGLVAASLARALGPSRGGLAVRAAHFHSVRIHLATRR